MITSADPPILLLLALLMAKHLIADFLLQTPSMLREKGDYGRLGGVLHAGLHGALSLPAMILCDVPVILAATLALMETAVHYHIDWGKERLSRLWAEEGQGRRFWVLVGVDQFAHQLTYLVMIAAVAG